MLTALNPDLMAARESPGRVRALLRADRGQRVINVEVRDVAQVRATEIALAELLAAGDSGLDLAESGTLWRGLLADLWQRGLDTVRPIPAVLDGSEALAAVVREVFYQPVIQRCQTPQDQIPLQRPADQHGAKQPPSSEPTYP